MRAAAIRMTCGCAGPCAHVADAGARAADPSGTSRLRSRFRSTLAIRWRGLRVSVREILVTSDVLQLGLSDPMRPVASPLVSTASKIQTFQRWLDHALGSLVTTGAQDLRPFVLEAYEAGKRHAERDLGQSVPMSIDRVDAIAEVAHVELQGIAEAVSQQSVRIVSKGLLSRPRPMELTRQVWDRIDKVGISRTASLVDSIVLTAFNNGSLDVYESAGVAEVDTIPEMVRPSLPTGDADVLDAKTGPGSRSSRKRTPSGSTIRRIEKVEQELSKLKRVKVKTAGDDRVCPICQSISRRGPYSIDRARSLIPAHPKCRCVFVRARAKNRTPAQREAEALGSAAMRAILGQPPKAERVRVKARTKPRAKSKRTRARRAR